MPFVSVFIPAFKNVHFLKRLLDSIVEQDFTDYEVIITDDSPDSEVENLVAEYQTSSPNKWTYSRNTPSLGMARNWNKGLEMCSGEWIKIMHDDDWLAVPNALSLFVQAIKDSSALFAFSAFTNIYSDGRREERHASSFRLKLLRKNPMTLLSSNIIGPPSVCMVHHSIKERYDVRLRWRIDQDYYIRVLKQSQGLVYINEPLVNIGINVEQVTNEVKYNKQIELPEALVFFQKYGVGSFKSIFVYDSWWRLMRNLEIKNINEVNGYLNTDEWPDVMRSIITDINKLSPSQQKKGIVSKLAMFRSYIKNRRRLS